MARTRLFPSIIPVKNGLQLLDVHPHMLMCWRDHNSNFQPLFSQLLTAMLPSKQGYRVLNRKQLDISQRCELISSNILCVSFFAAQTANCASGCAVGPETTPTSLVSSISHFLYTNSAENGAPGYIWCSLIQSWSDLLYKVLHPPISLVVQTSTWFLLFFHHLKSNSFARQINANKPT